MFENRYLSRWQQAGLLDAATADQIRVYEAAQHRPLWLWAVAGLGCFAISVGIASVVAANWGRISANFKLSIDFALLVALAGGLLFAATRPWPRIRDLIAFLLFGLVLASIALISQIYHLDGKPWQAMATWMAICTPFLLLGTSSRLLVVAWALGAAATVLVGGEDILSLLKALIGGEPVTLLAWLLAVGFILASLLLTFWPGRLAQAGTLRQIGLAGLLMAGSLPQLSYPSSLTTPPSWMEPLIGLGFAAAALSLMALLRTTGRSLLPVAALLMAAGFSWFVSVAIVQLAGNNPSMTRSEDRELVSLLLAAPFIAYWGFAGWLALRGGHRLLFIGAFAVIAVRVLIFYWEAFGGLLQTGLGLITGGVLCLLLAAAGRWLLSRASRPAQGTPA